MSVALGRMPVATGFTASRGKPLPNSNRYDLKTMLTQKLSVHKKETKKRRSKSAFKITDYLFKPRLKSNFDLRDNAFLIKDLN